jgi:hypothetical protein
LSFLKEPALDYFEPFLVNNPVNEPAWLTNFEYFTEELYIYFGPYDQQAQAEIELDERQPQGDEFLRRPLPNFGYARP